MCVCPSAEDDSLVLAVCERGLYITVEMKLPSLINERSASLIGSFEQMKMNSYLANSQFANRAKTSLPAFSLRSLCGVDLG